MLICFQTLLSVGSTYGEPWVKAKRVKAIKSKTFSRHNRKTGALKMIDGEGGEGGGDDDAALEAGMFIYYIPHSPPCF